MLLLNSGGAKGPLAVDAAGVSAAAEDRLLPTSSNAKVPLVADAVSGPECAA